MHRAVDVVRLSRQLDCSASVTDHDLDSDPLLNVDEAARKVGLSPWTIRAWLSQGRLRRTKVGSRVFVRQSELSRIVRD
jgi:excisionase family DNA binding protein